MNSSEREHIKMEITEKVSNRIQRKNTEESDNSEAIRTQFDPNKTFATISRSEGINLGNETGAQRKEKREYNVPKNKDADVNN